MLALFDVGSRTLQYFKLALNVVKQKPVFKFRRFVRSMLLKLTNMIFIQLWYAS